MKIKAVIVTKDETYLARLKSRLSAQYSSKIQASFFTETERLPQQPRIFVPICSWSMRTCLWTI